MYVLLIVVFVINVVVERGVVDQDVELSGLGLRNLSADLDKRGRNEWMREEMKVLTSPATYRFEPEHAWERLKTRVRKPKELAVLIEVAAWREREAQERDVP